MRYALVLVGVNAVLLCFFMSVGATSPHLANTGTKVALIGVISGGVAVLCRMARR